MNSERRFGRLFSGTAFKATRSRRIWPDWWNWSDPEFLVRVVDDRQAVGGEMTKDLLDMVELIDDVLVRLAKADSV